LVKVAIGRSVSISVFEDDASKPRTSVCDDVLQMLEQRHGGCSRFVDVDEVDTGDVWQVPFSVWQVLFIW
jgi:hypothetical protein